MDVWVCKNTLVCIWIQAFSRLKLNMSDFTEIPICPWVLRTKCSRQKRTVFQHRQTNVWKAGSHHIIDSPNTLINCNTSSKESMVSSHRRLSWDLSAGFSRAPALLIRHRLSPAVSASYSSFTATPSQCSARAKHQNITSPFALLTGFTY